MRSIRRYAKTREVAGEAEFYRWLQAFGMKVISVLNPANETQALEFREDAETSGQHVVTLGGNLISVQ